MKWKILILSLFLLSFSPLNVQACDPGDPQSLAYIRRDDNRCEGLQKRNVSSRFDLISLSTGKLNVYPAILNIRIPMTGNTPPELEVQSFSRKYLLDQVKFQSSTSGFTFLLKTTVLQNAGIPSESLRSLASINRNGEIIYIPVILGTVSDKYEFVLYSSKPTTLRTVEIRYKGQKFYPKDFPRKIPQKQIHFTWTYGNAPAGIYELYLVDGQNQPHTFPFQHHPSLL
jgi:flagellar basal-body rod modification protein FlgD